MRTLWFVVPAHGRERLAEICLRQLARTCDRLRDLGVRASAVVIADDENLDIARAMGFATVERDNHYLGRKWNDGYQAAAREDVEFVVPFGTDDWALPGLFAADQLPAPGELRCCRQTAVVNEGGSRLAQLKIPYEGGDGVRIWPTSTFKRLDYRPSDEDRERAIDTSVLMNVKRSGQKLSLRYYDFHPLQVVDFKSAEQLNSYESCLMYQVGRELDPWRQLRNVYPRAALEQMRGFYAGALV